MIEYVVVIKDYSGHLFTGVYTLLMPNVKTIYFGGLLTFAGIQGITQKVKHMCRLHRT